MKYLFLKSNTVMSEYATNSANMARYFVELVMNPKVSITQIVNSIVYAASIKGGSPLHLVKYPLKNPMEVITTEPQ